MEFKLIEPINPNYTALQQILHNRGIKDSDMYSYINTTDSDINDYMLFGEDVLKHAAEIIVNAIKQQYNTLIVVDCDCDGYTASAAFINYFYKIFPSWVENNIEWYMHDGKQHGLSDCCDWIINKNKYKLVIVPDAGSNDIEYHKKLQDNGIDVIILDHHITDEISPFAITINNQISEYPNKYLSGVGVVWQFCRYFDSLLKTDFSNSQLDLVAIGLCGDMMSLLDKETKHLQNKGFKQIKNPFINGMWEKNKYKLGDLITHMGAAFYIVPFVNAITRSGTLEEKELVFKSMLTHKAFEEIPSTKRGQIGYKVSLVDEAILVCDRVKRRQTKEQDEGLEIIEAMIEERNLLDHKVLLFLLDEDNNISPNLRGLIANKIMAKYQRPCAILTKTIVPPWEEGPEVIYQGSMRGYTDSGIESFKDICDATGLIEYCSGHENAAGLGISEESIDSFIEATDILLKDMRSEVIYNVDYIYEGKADIRGEDILDIASHEELWGQDMPEPLFAVKGLKITTDMITLMSPDKSPTIKIQVGNVSILKFKSSQEEYESLCSPGYTMISLVAKANLNEWNGRISPQLFIEDYRITSKVAWDF